MSRQTTKRSLPLEDASFRIALFPTKTATVITVSLTSGDRRSYRSHVVFRHRLGVCIDDLAGLPTADCLRLLLGATAAVLTLSGASAGDSPAVGPGAPEGATG